MDIWTIDELRDGRLIVRQLDAGYATDTEGVAQWLARRNPSMIIFFGTLSEEVE